MFDKGFKFKRGMKQKLRAELIIKLRRKQTKIIVVNSNIICCFLSLSVVVFAVLSLNNEALRISLNLAC